MKLTYFDYRARAEVTRLMLAQAGVEYEDIRITQEQWGEMKEGTRWGSLPTIDDGDVHLGQSHSVARYIANKYGFAGKTNQARMGVDVVMDVFIDIITPMYKMFGEGEEAEKAAQDFAEGTPAKLAMLEKMKQINGGQYMIGEDLTMADFRVQDVLFTMKSMGEKCPIDLSQYPGLVGVHDMVSELPNIKKWIETRPQNMA